MTDRIPLDPPPTIEPTGDPNRPWLIRHPEGERMYSTSGSRVSDDWLRICGYTVPVLPDPLPEWAEALGLTWDEIERLAVVPEACPSYLVKLCAACREAVAARKAVQS